MSDQDDFMRAIEEGGGRVVLRGGLGMIRRAKALALEDGRAWEELSADAMDRYLDLATHTKGPGQ